MPVEPFERMGCRMPWRTHLMQVQSNCFFRYFHTNIYILSNILSWSRYVLRKLGFQMVNAVTDGSRSAREMGSKRSSYVTLSIVKDTPV